MTDEEVECLKQLLNKSTPGDLPPEVFEAVARVAVYPAVEFIPLREKNGQIEVLLFQRPAHDLIWPNMWHTPGTVLRPTDETYDNAFDRLVHEELKDLKIGKPIFLGAELSKNDRGAVVLLEHLVIADSEPKAGRFYRIDQLPNTFIEDQRASLERAVQAFRQRYSREDALVC